MSSMIAMLLNKEGITVAKPGRVIRFGLPEGRVLTDGPVRDRVVSCLESSSAPMRISDIAEAVQDCEMRVQRALRKLTREGRVEEMGAASSSLNLRFRIL